MASAADSRGQSRRRTTNGQSRGERTRLIVIEETVRCIREDGFAAATTRHIIKRAGVSWGVIQYHFGDRDGLLTAVIEHAFAILTNSLNEIADSASDNADEHARADDLTAAAWSVLFTPTSMSALEILIATRAMRGTLEHGQLDGLNTAFQRIAGLLGDTTPHASAIATLLWASPIGMMVAQMVLTAALPTDPEQQALSALIGHHLRQHRNEVDPG